MVPTVVTYCGGLPELLIVPEPAGVVSLPIANPPAQHLDQIILIEIIEKPLDVGFNHEVVPSKLELDRQFVDRIERSLVRAIPITTSQEILLVDGFQYPRDRQLQQLIFDHRNPKRAHFPVRLRYPVPSDQSGPVTLPLQPLDEIPDVVDQVLSILVCADSIHAIGRVLSNIAPAFEQKILIDEPIEVEEPGVFPFLSLLCYRQQ